MNPSVMSMIFLSSCMLSLARPTMLATNLRMGSRVSNVSCLGPGEYFVCEDDPEELCLPCCEYDHNHPSIHFPNSIDYGGDENSSYQARVSSCHAFLDADGYPTRCGCGPAPVVDESRNLKTVTGEIQTKTKVTNPIARGHMETDGKTFPLGRDLQECFLDGDSVNADPTLGCDSSDCCSNSCICLTVPNRDSICRCAPAHELGNMG